MKLMSGINVDYSQDFCFFYSSPTLILLVCTGSSSTYLLSSISSVLDFHHQSFGCSSSGTYCFGVFVVLSPLNF